MRPHRPYSKTEIKIVATMHDDGASPSAIAERIGRGSESVQKKIDKLVKARGRSVVDRRT